MNKKEEESKNNQNVLSDELMNAIKTSLTIMTSNDICPITEKIINTSICKGCKYLVTFNSLNESNFPIQCSYGFI